MVVFSRIVVTFLIFSCLSFSSGTIVSSSKKLQQPAQGDDLKEFHENFYPQVHKNDQVIKHTAFTLCYDEKYEQAKWVAYCLTDKMCENKEAERTNNFRADESIKTGSATPSDYKKSGYDRGHLCPAGDMSWNELAMNESFLMSNMSPQIPAFNRGIWNVLEGDVRNWTRKNKELYIVTAGVLQDTLKTIGTNKVAVPNYYYKIILDVSLPEYKAIAFVMPNKESKTSVFNYAVSIDSVERLTGINFFPALPDSLESILESKIDINLWSK
jgi:endonuclease G